MADYCLLSSFYGDLRKWVLESESHWLVAFPGGRIPDFRDARHDLRRVESSVAMEAV